MEVVEGNDITEKGEHIPLGALYFVCSFAL